MYIYKISSNTIFNFNLNFNNCWLIQRSKKVVTSVGTLVLTVYRILSPPDCVFVFTVSIWPPNRPHICIFWPRNIDLMWNCPLKPHVLHSSSAFRSGTSAPFLGQNKYMYGRFGVPVGTMDSRGPSGDLARRVGWNYGALNNYRNHEK
jgi:hypothetical protein